MGFFVSKMFWDCDDDEPMNIRELYVGICWGMAIEQVVDALHGVGNQFVVRLRDAEKL